MAELSQGNAPMYPDLLYRAFYFGLDYGELTSAGGAGTLQDLQLFRARCSHLAGQWRERAVSFEIERRGAMRAVAQFRAARYAHFAALKVPGDFAALSARIEQDSCNYICEVLPAQWHCLVEPVASDLYRGYLLKQSGAKGVVWVIGGLDSRKEIELLGMARVFLADGFDVLLLDMPGQGTQLGLTTLANAYDAASLLVLDELASRRAYQKIVLCGLSLGGFLALRSAQDARVAACVSFGGFYDGKISRHLPPQIKAHLTLALNGDYADDGSFEWLSLESLPPKVPCLQVHGENDALVDSEQIKALCRWHPHLQLMRVAGAEHVCTSRFAWLLPEVLHWIKLQAEVR